MKDYISVAFSAFAAFVGGLVLYVYNKCKIGWVAADQNLHDEIEEDLKLLDSKISARSTEIFKRMDGDREAYDRKAEEREKRVTDTLEALRAFIELKMDKSDEKIDNIQSHISKQSTDIAVLKEKSNRKREDFE